MNLTLCLHVGRTGVLVGGWVPRLWRPLPVTRGAQQHALRTAQQGTSSPDTLQGSGQHALKIKIKRGAKKKEGRKRARTK